VQIAYWHWLVLGMVLLIAEVFAPAFVIVWFGVAALIVGGLLFLAPTLDISWQLLLWGLLSAGLALAWFRWLHPRMVDRTTAGVADREVAGAVGVVLRRPQPDQRGRVRFSPPLLGAEDWEFISEDPTLAEGDTVRVMGILGNTLRVARPSAPASNHSGEGV